MIKIISSKTEVEKSLRIRRLVFPLKVSRNVWLTDNKLILEYPLKFHELNNIGDAVVFSLLPIAFREASDIELPANLLIEKGTQERIDKICNLWNRWYLCNRRVKIFSKSVEPLEFDGKKRFGAQLFSGGVDALTTFKRNRDRIKYLVLYQGAPDIPASRPNHFKKVKKYIQEFADEQKKELITISTNVNYLSAASWMLLAQSCAMIGPLLAFSKYINKIYIASSNPSAYANRLALGSHPDLDPLVRTEKVESIHDGAELKRIEKTALLATEQILLRRLRVCNNIGFFDRNAGNHIDRYNCGKCEKCYRTATALTILGISHEQVPFPKETMSTPNILNFLKTSQFGWGDKLEWSENLELLESFPRDFTGKERLRSMLHKILGSYYEDYKRGFPCGMPKRGVSKWRNLERNLGLRLDSLQWLKKLLRSVRGKPYREFVKMYEHLTKSPKRVAND